MKKLVLTVGTLFSVNAFGAANIDCQIDNKIGNATWKYDASVEMLEDGKFPESIKVSIARELSDGTEVIYLLDQPATLKKENKTYAYYDYPNAAYGLRYLVSLRDLGEKAELSVYHRLSEAGSLESATADCQIN